MREPYSTGAKWPPVSLVASLYCKSLRSNRVVYAPLALARWNAANSHKLRIISHTDLICMHENPHSER